MTGKRDLGLEYATGFGAPGITHFLYDLQNDPTEVRNLAALPQYTEIVNTLQADLIKKFKDTHPYAHELPHNLNTEGHLVWFCEPRDVGAEYGGRPLRIFIGD